jgi:hypothetical protein
MIKYASAFRGSLFFLFLKGKKIAQYSLNACSVYFFRLAALSGGTPTFVRKKFDFDQNFDTPTFVRKKFDLTQNFGAPTFVLKKFDLNQTFLTGDFVRQQFDQTHCF